MAAFNPETFRITNAPESVYYVRNFITIEDEKYLLNRIDKTPALKWTQLSNRRLQNWGGLPKPSGMIAEKIDPWLMKFLDRVNSLKIFEDKMANHILLNEYKPGQGIMPHLDGDLFYPTISTISLGSHTVMHFYEQDLGEENNVKSLHERRVCSLFIEPRSLLVLKNDMYNKYLHGIEEVSEDTLGSNIARLPEGSSIGSQMQRGIRYSLTIRNVPKTSKIKFKFGKGFWKRLKIIR